jgi:hypothetical protein
MKRKMYFNLLLLAQHCNNLFSFQVPHVNLELEQSTPAQCVTLSQSGDRLAVAMTDVCIIFIHDYHLSHYFSYAGMSYPYL